MFARFYLLWIMNWRATAGRPYGLCEIFNLLYTENYYKYADFLGGSKPPPYNTIWYKFTFTDNRIFSLPCKGCGSPVETSAFNAEAPTEPAGETVGCRRQLGGIVRLILYEFIKSFSHFLFQKNDSSLCKGAFDGQGQATAEIHIKFNSCFRPIFEGAVIFTEKWLREF